MTDEIIPNRQYMTEDEQEALSYRYILPRVVRLCSGRFALFIEGQDLQIVDDHALLSSIPSTEDLDAYYESRRPAQRAQGKLTALDLDELLNL